MAAQDYLSYTYLIGWSHLDKWYYGVRYAQDKSYRKKEFDLWIDYFASSDYVDEAIEKYGTPNIILYDEIFETPEEAILYEKKILTEQDVLNDDRWLNQSIGGAIVYTKRIRQKMSERKKEKYLGNGNPFFGKNHSEKTKKKQRDAKKGRYFGKNNPNYGNKHSEEQKKKWSEERKGRPAHNRQSIEINGIIYESITKAAQELNVKRQTLQYRIKNNKTPLI